jgi:hypothetical protein
MRIIGGIDRILSARYACCRGPYCSPCLVDLTAWASWADDVVSF